MHIQTLSNIQTQQNFQGTVDKSVTKYLDKSAKIYRKNTINSRSKKAGEKDLNEMWKLVVETYKSKGFTEEDALRNARMARILRAEDYDFNNKEIKLWTI